jgi:hypothetical protein
MVRVSVHVSIAGRNLLIRKTVRLSRKRK